MTTQSFRKQYGTEAACLKALLNIRIGPERLCVNEKCRAPVDRYYHPLKGRKAFICSRCLRHVYPMANSIFGHSHVEINDWFEIIFKFLYCRNGVSASEIHRTYGYSYPTAYKMLHSIRALMHQALNFDLENTVVEIDEAGISTGTKGLGKHFRFSTGRGSEKHTGVLAIIERRGVAKLFVIQSSDAETLLPIILDNVPKTTIIYTDSWGAYNRLKELGYEHSMVNHSIEFVNESASTNNCESMFSNLRRMLVGTYHMVSDGTLQHYLNEHAFRHSYRFEKDYGFQHLLRCLSDLSNSPNLKKIAA